jgi:hypothetical protein
VAITAIVPAGTWGSPNACPIAAHYGACQPAGQNGKLALFGKPKATQAGANIKFMIPPVTGAGEFVASQSTGYVSVHIPPIRLAISGPEIDTNLSGTNGTGLENCAIPF